MTRARIHLDNSVSQIAVESLQDPATKSGRPSQRLTGDYRILICRTCVDKSKLENEPQRFDAVTPADVLAFCIGAAVIRDRNLVDARPPLRQAGGHLGLEAESVRSQTEPLQHVPPDRLVTGLHVGEIQVVGHVGEGCQQSIPERMPEEEDATDLARCESGAVDGVGFPVKDRRDDLAVFLRVILEVGVLDDPDVAAHMLDRRPDGLPLAHIDRLRDDLDPAVVCGQLLEDLEGVVREQSSTHTNSISQSTGEARTRSTMVRKVRDSLYTGIRTERVGI